MPYITPDSFIARSNLGSSWLENWDSLLSAKKNFKIPNMEKDFFNWPDGPPVGIIENWEGTNVDYSNRTLVLLGLLCDDLSAYLQKLREKHPAIKLSMIIATSHGDPGPVSASLGINQLDSHSLLSRIYTDHLEKVIYDKLGYDIDTSILSAACASAIVATQLACSKINNNNSDAVIIMSIDTLSLVAYSGFKQIGAMSSKGSRPFDVNRNGMTASEGAAGFVILSDKLSLASQTRFKVVSTGVFCDKSHMVEPSVQGLLRAFENCFSGVAVNSDVSFVYWHGTGTVLNDKCESETASSFFGKNIPKGCSTKGGLGHTMGASSGFNILAACSSLMTSLLPPTAGLEQCAFEEMNISGQVQKVAEGLGLCVALGFGGINASLLIKKINQQDGN